MNREELVEIMMEHIGETEGVVTMKRVLADRILAALAKEREGEVVLLEMPVDDEQGTIQDNLEAEIENINLQGKRGQLIFRPTKAEKGGE